MSIAEPRSGGSHRLPSIPAGPYPFSSRLPAPPSTTVDGLDAAVADVRANAGAWIATSPADRVRLLDEVIRATSAVADRWVDLGTRNAGLDPDGPGSAEAAIVGPYIFLRGARLHRQALAEIARSGRPRIPGPVRTLANGQLAARVFPTDLVDRLTYLGTTADVWMDPAVSQASLPATMARAYQRTDPARVCLVLGAGNASSIAPLDILHKLFVENEVVVCKTHPVMAYLAEVHEAALRPLVDAGVLRIVYGAAAEGAYLCTHPGVDDLHITGSDRTYEAIVYGTGQEGVERKRRDDPVLHKPFSAELGNLTPIIVVPGRWSAADLDYHADNIVTMLTNNAGFNCTTSRVIVTSARWPQRDDLLDRIRRRLGAIPPRLAYYPGAHERFAAFEEIHPEAELLGPGRDRSAVGAGSSADGSPREAGSGLADGHLPWMLIPNLSPDAAGDPCYRVEAFCSVTAETVIDAPDTAAFLERAVRFANETLWGTLNATLIVDPATARDRDTGPAIERAIADLRYGTVSVNHWSSIGYGLGITPWGAFPGHHRSDIQSGAGFVHNPLMFGAVQKTVVRSPFRAWPKPVWFASHRTAHRLVRQLVPFEADRATWRLLPILALALLG